MREFACELRNRLFLSKYQIFTFVIRAKLFLMLFKCCILIFLFELRSQKVEEDLVYKHMFSHFCSQKCVFFFYFRMIISSEKAKKWKYFIFVKSKAKLKKMITHFFSNCIRSVLAKNKKKKVQKVLG